MIKLNFTTDYHQFYVADKADHLNTSEFWTPPTEDSRLAIADGVIGVYVNSESKIRGELVVLESPTELKFDKYDHEVEGSLEIKSGRLEILDCPFSSVEAEVSLVPRFYRVRVLSSNLDSARDDEDNAKDFYRIEIWPAPKMELKVWKQFTDK